MHPAAQTRNVGNRFLVDDLSAETAVTYSVDVLKVQHIIVVGHYGCGAIASAMTRDPHRAWSDFSTARIDAWTRPIQRLFESSNRTEIVEFRKANENMTTVAAPDKDHPAFKALVEENVKQTVLSYAQDPAVREVSAHTDLQCGVCC